MNAEAGGSSEAAAKRRVEEGLEAPRDDLLARRTKAGAYHQRHDASAKSDDEPDPWAPSKTARP